MDAAFLTPLMPFFWRLIVPAECFSSLLSLAGLDDKKCNVVPKNLYVEVGSSVEVMCQSWCVRGKIFWTLNNRLLEESLSKTINSSHTVLTLAHITEPVATLQCHSSDIQQILGGTTIITYSKKYIYLLLINILLLLLLWYLLAALDGYNNLFYVVLTAKPTQLSCTLHQTTEGLPGLLTCSWEHRSNSSLQINYSVMW